MQGVGLEALVELHTSETSAVGVNWFNDWLFPFFVQCCCYLAQNKCLVLLINQRTTVEV